DFERINALFQQTDRDPYDPAKELSMHYNSLYGRLYFKDRTPKILENVEFGAKFN
ncbi:hypothetical protein SK128_008999, partial [Halocaridina rubra]